MGKFSLIYNPWVIFTPLPSWSFFYTVTPWGKNTLRVTPGQFYPGQIFFYTSTASAASDKFHVCQKYLQRRKMCPMQVREVKCALHQRYQIRNLGWSPCIIFILLYHLCSVKLKQHYLTFLINFFCKSAVCMSRQGLCHSIRIVVRILLSDLLYLAN